MGNTIHVVKHPDGWATKQEGAQRASAVTRTQTEAISKARDIASNQGKEVAVHGKNGRIREKNSYGNDPFPPRG